MMNDKVEDKDIKKEFLSPNGKINLSLAASIRFFTLICGEIILFLISRKYNLFNYCFSVLSPKYLEKVSKYRYKRSIYLALKKIPAYQKLHQKTGQIQPVTDKENYIDSYSTADRCKHGILPTNNITIDESSGSTGMPYNWYRNIAERKHSHASISHFSSYCYGTEPFITINAFSMGAWATGVNMGIALQKNSIVKNTGPDIVKILHTIKTLGKDNKYLVLGYPPFMKQLIDKAVKEGFPLSDYSLDALVGGEGMSEGLREYIKTKFNRVYSGYGATDLEIGVAGETPISMGLRQLSLKHDDVKKELFGNDPRLPMIFQYNPLMHYIETNEKGELIFTITRQSLLTPRIKYNIHDQGGVMRYDEAKEKLDHLGFDIEDLAKDQNGVIIKLPFLWVNGRTDYTISIMGANIYPEDIESAVYADKYLSKITRSFCQTTEEGEDGQHRALFMFEIEDEVITPKLTKLFKAHVLEHLINLNLDFREAYNENPKSLVPIIELYDVGDGPFKMKDGQIKQKRLLK